MRVRALSGEYRSMQNDRAAIMRRLSDPDFQASLVNKSIALVLGMAAIIVAFVIHDIYIWMNPPTPRYFYIDGENPPRPATPLTSPIVDDAAAARLDRAGDPRSPTT